MTEEIFNDQIRKPEKIEDWLNYLLCSFMVLIGLFLFYKLFQSLTLNNGSIRLLYPAIFFFLLGAYGFWRISKDYKLIKIKSDQTSEQKRQIIEEYITTLKVKTFSMDGELFKITYRNKYFNSIDVYIAFDNEFYYLNARAADYGIKGVIDFGLTRRASRKLEAYFMRIARI